MPKKKKPTKKNKNGKIAFNMPGLFGGSKKGKKPSDLGTKVTRSGKIKKK